MPNTTVPIPSGMFIDTKIAFVASVLIRKFTHMGRINSNTKILLALYFARKYAAGYPRTMQIIVVRSPTRMEFPSTTRLDFSVKKIAKFLKLNFPS